MRTIAQFGQRFTAEIHGLISRRHGLRSREPELISREHGLISRGYRANKSGTGLISRVLSRTFSRARNLLVVQSAKPVAHGQRLFRALDTICGYRSSLA
jgi:hypothetical protein